jgi:hypothetical protein
VSAVITVSEAASSRAGGAASMTVARAVSAGAASAGSSAAPSGAGRIGPEFVLEHATSSKSRVFERMKKLS